MHKPWTFQHIRASDEFVTGKILQRFARLRRLSRFAWRLWLIGRFGDIVVMDLQNLIPRKTSRGDPVFVELDGRFANVYYKRRRARPKPVKIRRRISRDLLLVGVTIWACEGSRTRPYELEVTNSSEAIAKSFVQLLQQLGLSRYVTLRVHAPAVGYNRFKRHWRKTLGINRFEKPITTESRGREIKNGIIHIRVYGAMVRELFRHWANILPQLLRTSDE